MSPGMHCEPVSLPAIRRERMLLARCCDSLHRTRRLKGLVRRELASLAISLRRQSGSSSAFSVEVHHSRRIAACWLTHLQRTRPQRSRQQVRQCKRPQRSRQQRPRHRASVASLRCAVTPAEMGKSGAARELPGIAAKTKPTSDIARTMRIMRDLRW
jgi:hypothetical protein